MVSFFDDENQNTPVETPVEGAPVPAETPAPEAPAAADMPAA